MLTDEEVETYAKLAYETAHGERGWKWSGIHEDNRGKYCAGMRAAIEADREMMAKRCEDVGHEWEKHWRTVRNTHQGPAASAHAASYLDVAYHLREGGPMLLPPKR